MSAAPEIDDFDRMPDEAYVEDGAANSGDEETALKDAGDVTTDDFWAYMPAHQYVFTPSREMWPASSVNARCGDPTNPDGTIATKKIGREKKGGKVEFKDVPMSPSEWLDQNRAVEQMTWAPGMPMVIDGKLVANGGWIDRPGCRCFNLYIPPAVTLGYSDAVGPWLDHIKKIYPAEADHIVKWLAQRVQHPGQKINHALVLGGDQGIGKDTILEPIKYAVGPWNFIEVSPTQLLGRFNGFVKSVILRISEARDLGDVDRFAFYDHTKVYTAAPPDVLRCDEKHLREHAVLNICGVIITTNHKGDGIYLPADDRRHFVAWSSLTKDDFTPAYWNELYEWYSLGGTANVAAYLAKLDLTGFDPKAPPPKTAAFWEIVDSNRSQEDAELADVIDILGNPAALTLNMLISRADDSLRQWLQDRRNRRQVPHRLEEVGYTPIRNDADTHDGQWRVAGKRQTIYALKTLLVRDRIAAAQGLTR